MRTERGADILGDKVGSSGVPDNRGGTFFFIGALLCEYRKHLVNAVLVQAWHVLTSSPDCSPLSWVGWAQWGDG